VAGTGSGARMRSYPLNAKYPFPRLRAFWGQLRPSKQLERFSYQGFAKGSRPLVAIFIGLQVARIAKRAVARSAVTAAVEVLQPGQSVIITALGPAKIYGGKRPKA
jgi:hypothetical protein